MFDFEKLHVYKKSTELNLKVLNFLKENKNIDYFLKDQLKRASVSISINIAEGSGRFTKADKKNFYIISRGSCYECVSLLQIMKNSNFIDEVNYTNFYKEFEEVSKMIMGLINSQTQR